MKRLTKADEAELNAFLAREDIWGEQHDGVTPESFRRRCGTLLLNDPSYVILQPAKGMVFLARYLWNGVYQVHFNAANTIRGEKAIQAGIASLRWMTENTRCHTQMGVVPACRKQVRWFARQAGMKPAGVLPKCYWMNGKFEDAHLYLYQNGA